MKLQTIHRTVSESVQVLTSSDRLFTFETPKLGVFKHRPGAATDAFSAWLGREVDVALDFAYRGSWNLAPDWLMQPARDWVRAQPNRIYSLAVPMHPETGGFTLRAIADGAGDSAFRVLADRLMAHGLRGAYLRLGWEMDLTGTKWGKAPQGSGLEPDFAAAFRRIVTVMREQQPSNAWSYELVTGQGWKDRRYLDAIWPGDEFVDRVGMDIYEADWFGYVDGYPLSTAATDAQRRRAAQEWWNRYSWWLNTMRDFALEHGKRLCIPEWSCYSNADVGGGDSPMFIERMHDFIMDPGNAVDWHGIYSITQSWQLDPPTVMPHAGERFRELFRVKGQHFIAGGLIEKEA